MTRLLITGASGFIGSAIGRAFQDSDHEVWGWSRVMGPRTEIPRARYIEADLLGEPSGLPPSIDILVHCAGVATPGAALASPSEAMRANAAGAARAFEVARATGAAVILLSSVYVYDGSGDPPWDEAAPLDPISPLGASKLAAEAIARSYWRCFGTPSALLRLFTVYGPGSSDEYFVPSAIRKISAAERSAEFGPGASTRDFIYIDDVVAAVVSTAARVRGMGCETFNIASGRETSISDAVATIQRVLNKTDLEVTYHRLPVRPDEARTGSSRHAAVIEKARRTLEWSPTIDLADGVRRMCASMLKRGTW